MSPTEANEFFKQLPADRLTYKEEVLRDALFTFLDSWSSEAPPTLSDACNAANLPDDALEGTKMPQSEVVLAKQALLPTGITLTRWIKERVGDEFEFGMTEWHTEHFQRFGQLDMADVRRPEKKENQETAEFFASLPEDSLTPEEDELRSAICDFLDSWPHAYPPSVSDACKNDLNVPPSSNRVIAARRLALPAKVKLGQWMEERIGGEIEVDKSSVNNHYFHHRGMLNLDALPGKT